MNEEEGEEKVDEEGEDEEKDSFSPDEVVLVTMKSEKCVIVVF